MLGIEKFAEWTENEVFVAAGIAHHEFDATAATLAAVGTAAAVAGIALAYVLWLRGRLPAGLTRRNRAARAGYTFLANRYYLDHLYTGVVVGGIKGPIARAAYWVDQNVIDGIVNAFGIAARESGRWVYDHVDQKVVDGAVNGAGFGAQGFGGILRTIQTGQVQQYGALLFGAAVLLGLGLAIFT
jgi:NADH-quinone oxidoreductase subunit L